MSKDEKKEIKPPEAPLADRMRPQTLEDFAGQAHLLSPNKTFRKLLEKDALGSIILWGPPGTGKTTLARLIAKVTNRKLDEIKAVNAGLADLRKAIQTAQKEIYLSGQKTIIFIDEIHRFNKLQQDAVLPDVENGGITLIGTTTENPSFEIIPPLRSRCKIYRLEHLNKKAIEKILLSAIKDQDQGLGKYHLEITSETIQNIIDKTGGDARCALNTLEAAALSIEPNAEGKRKIEEKTITEVLLNNAIFYDKGGDNHYDHASAFQKSLRGSDPDAAVYWLGKMIAGGEEPRFIARRLIITASEDVGNADPFALILAVNAAEAAEKIGFPEARIPLTQATIYIACAVKSNSCITAIDFVLNDLQNGKSFPVPKHLKDAHYQDAAKYGYGTGYKYPHDYPLHYVAQDYLPEKLIGKKYYLPSEQGQEKIIKDRLEKIKKRS